MEFCSVLSGFVMFLVVLRLLAWGLVGFGGDQRAFVLHGDIPELFEGTYHMSKKKQQHVCFAVFCNRKGETCLTSKVRFCGFAVFRLISGFYCGPMLLNAVVFNGTFV